MVTIGTREVHLFKDDFNMLGDFFDFFCAEFIGEGAFRTVYQYRHEKNWVVKICRIGFDNIVEWELYKNVKHEHPELAKFLAKPIALSNSGKVMLMEKTERLKGDHEIPKLVPEFLADIKAENWGRIGRRVVCHDYGNNRLFSKMTTKLIKRH